MERQRDWGRRSCVALYLVLGIKIKKKKNLPLPFQLCLSTACLLKCRTEELGAVLLTLNSVLAVEKKRIKINIVAFKCVLIPAVEN